MAIYSLEQYTDCSLGGLMNRLQLSAFGEEIALIKHANLSNLASFGQKALGLGRKAAGLGRDALYKGWHGFDRGADALTKSTQGTKWFGMKGLTVGLTASQLPDAMKAEDPSGQGRSRSERLARLAGNTAGGIATSGVLANKTFGPKGPGLGKGLARFGANAAVQIGVGTAGVIGGEALASAPFKMLKKNQPAQQANQGMNNTTALQTPNQQSVYSRNSVG